jgi:hypothetical protein
LSLGPFLSVRHNGAIRNAEDIGSYLISIGVFIHIRGSG